MDDLQERDLCRVRLRFLDLINSFFVEEPDAEKMGRWRGTFSALAGEQVSPRFDTAVREIGRVLGDKSLQELQEEYSKLFVDPFDGAQIETTASYYLNGRSYDQALVDIRSLMDEAGLRKEAAFSEPEDSLVVLLDTFSSLVEEEKLGGGETVRVLQRRLLEEYLVPLVAKLLEALEKAEGCEFYLLCCRVLDGYLELEKGLMYAE